MTHVDSTQAATLITGANRGIGFALVEHYLAKNKPVIATYRAQAGDLDTLRDNPLLSIEQLDVTDSNSITALSTSLATRPIELLINNAGIYGPKPGAFEAIQADDWQQVLHTNTIAPFFVTKALLDNLKQVSKHRIAKVAMISSKMGSMNDNQSGGSYIYRSSKAALNAVVKSLSIDFANDNIAITAIHPGWVLTDMGGPNALISTKQSTAGIMHTISELTLDNSGQFVNYNGEVIPW